jgi:hypothetical protein
VLNFVAPIPLHARLRSRLRSLLPGGSPLAAGAAFGLATLVFAAFAQAASRRVPNVCRTRAADRIRPTRP